MASYHLRAVHGAVSNAVVRSVPAGHTCCCIPATYDEIMETIRQVEEDLKPQAPTITGYESLTVTYSNTSYKTGNTVEDNEIEATMTFKATVTQVWSDGSRKVIDVTSQCTWSGASQDGVTSKGGGAFDIYGRVADGTMIRANASYTPDTGSPLHASGSHTYDKPSAQMFTLTIVADPSDSQIKIDGTVRSTITVAKGTQVRYEVSHGVLYTRKEGTYTVNSDYTMEVTLTIDVDLVQDTGRLSPDGGEAKFHVVSRSASSNIDPRCFDWTFAEGWARFSYFGEDGQDIYYAYAEVDEAPGDESERTCKVSISANEQWFGENEPNFEAPLGEELDSETIIQAIGQVTAAAGNIVGPNPILIAPYDEQKEYTLRVQLDKWTDDGFFWSDENYAVSKKDSPGFKNNPVKSTDRIFTVTSQQHLGDGLYEVKLKSNLPPDTGDYVFSPDGFSTYGGWLVYCYDIKEGYDKDDVIEQGFNNPEYLDYVRHHTTYDTILAPYCSYTCIKTQDGYTYLNAYQENTPNKVQDSLMFDVDAESGKKSIKFNAWLFGNVPYDYRDESVSTDFNEIRYGEDMYSIAYFTAPENQGVEYTQVSDPQYFKVETSGSAGISNIVLNVPQMTRAEMMECTCEFDITANESTEDIKNETIEVTVTRPRPADPEEHPNHDRTSEFKFTLNIRQAALQYDGKPILWCTSGATLIPDTAGDYNIPDEDYNPYPWQGSTAFFPGEGITWQFDVEVGQPAPGGKLYLAAYTQYLAGDATTLSGVENLDNYIEIDDSGNTWEKIVDDQGNRWFSQKPEVQDLGENKYRVTVYIAPCEYSRKKWEDDATDSERGFAVAYIIDAESNMGANINFRMEQKPAEEPTLTLSGNTKLSAGDSTNQDYILSDVGGDIEEPQIENILYTIENPRTDGKIYIIPEFYHSRMVENNIIRPEDYNEWAVSSDNPTANSTWGTLSHVPSMLTVFPDAGSAGDNPGEGDSFDLSIGWNSKPWGICAHIHDPRGTGKIPVIRNDKEEYRLWVRYVYGSNPVKYIEKSIDIHENPNPRLMGLIANGEWLEDTDPRNKTHEFGQEGGTLTAKYKMYFSNTTAPNYFGHIDVMVGYENFMTNFRDNISPIKLFAPYTGSTNEVELPESAEEPIFNDDSSLFGVTVDLPISERKGTWVDFTDTITLSIPQNTTGKVRGNLFGVSYNFDFRVNQANGSTYSMGFVSGWYLYSEAWKDFYTNMTSHTVDSTGSGLQSNVTFIQSAENSSEPEDETDLSGLKFTALYTNETPGTSGQTLWDSTKPSNPIQTITVPASGGELIIDVEKRLIDEKGIVEGLTVTDGSQDQGGSFNSNIVTALYDTTDTGYLAKFGNDLKPVVGADGQGRWIWTPDNAQESSISSADLLPSYNTTVNVYDEPGVSWTRITITVPENTTGERRGNDMVIIDRCTLSYNSQNLEETMYISERNQFVNGYNVENPYYDPSLGGSSGSKYYQDYNRFGYFIIEQEA